MSELRRRLRLLEGRTHRQPAPADVAVRAALRRLSLGELEGLESAIMAQEAGRALDTTQRAAMDAWERVAPDDAA